MFHVGQKVTYTEGDDLYEGVVSQINEADSYPIIVTNIYGGSENFTLDGRMYDWLDRVHLFPLEEQSASPQDFLSELKALLKKYDATISVDGAYLDRSSLTLEVAGKEVYDRGIWAGGFSLSCDDF